MDIIYQDPGGIGYHPVLHMVRLASELFEANLLILEKNCPVGLWTKLCALMPSRKRGSDCCLVICPAPPSLSVLQLVPGWRKRYEKIVAWVFDSFWVNHVPRFAKKPACPYDHVFVTEPEDLDAWKQVTGVPVSWLPWGSDALKLGSDAEERPVDLLRVGRQPDNWKDDRRTEMLCKEKGICFHGRPARHIDMETNMNELMASYSRAKFSLSWSNRVSPAIQTHPDREYITGRWTDALAAGTIVAGIPPQTSVVQELFWPGALLELSTTDLDQGLEEIRQAVRQWMPVQARLNARNALRRLDWRWRFKIIADNLGIMPETLARELARLETVAT